MHKVRIEERQPFGYFECRKCKRAVTVAYEHTDNKGKMLITEWECDDCFKEAQNNNRE
jgi:hypothetical protein